MFLDFIFLCIHKIRSAGLEGNRNRNIFEPMVFSGPCLDVNSDYEFNS